MAEQTEGAQEGRIGRYELGPLLAKGGMAELHLARVAGPHGFRKYVVLKRIRAEWADDREFVAMFLDEARLAAQLDHPNVVPVHDIGEDEAGPFFTMDYVHGEDLLAVIGRCRENGETLPWGVFLAIAAGAAAGLHHAHERKGFHGSPLHLIHRDVSPSNILVSYEGTVKVVDFGIAKAATSRHSTRPSVRKGKIAYMSPEQCRGAPLDRRSDLFALGVVLYELATLEHAFDAEGEYAVLNQIVNHDLPPVSSRGRPIPEAIERIVMKLVARDVADRYQTAFEVQLDCGEAATALGLVATPASIAAHMDCMFGVRPLPWERSESDADQNDRGADAPRRSTDQTAVTSAMAVKVREPVEPATTSPRRATVAVLVACAGLGLGYLGWRSDAGPAAQPRAPAASTTQEPLPTEGVADPRAGSSGGAGLDTGSEHGTGTAVDDSSVDTVVPDVGAASAGEDGEDAEDAETSPPTPSRPSHPSRPSRPRPRPAPAKDDPAPTFDPDAPAPRPR